MSAKLNLYKDYLVQIKTKALDVETTGLWNNQFDAENEKLIAQINFPAIYIEFAAVPWDQTLQQTANQASGANPLSKVQKTGNCVITIHHGFNPLGDVDLSFAEILPQIESVYFALQNMEGDEYNPLRRIGERQDTDHGRIIDWQTDFGTQLSQLGEEVPDLIEIAKDVLAIELTKDFVIAASSTSGVRTDKTIP